jgi:iron complex outermembrane receptor protein
LDAKTTPQGVNIARVFTPYDAVQTTYVVPDYQAYTSELTFNGDLFDDKLKWTTGGFFFAESASGGSAQYLYSPNYARPQAVSGRQVTLSDLSHNSGDNKSYAAYAQGTYNILDSLRLTAGARYTIDQREANIVSQTVRFPATAATNATVTNSVFSPGTYYLNGIGYTGYSTSCAIQDAKGVSLPLNACMLDVHKTFNRPTWMVSLDYDLFEHSLLYVTTRSGYRSGAINAGLNGSNANLLVALPETVQDYELGIKSDWEIAGMPIRTNIDGYYTDYHDIQTQVSLPFVALAVGPGGGPCTQAAFNAALCTGTSTQGVMVNAKRADIYGAEWDIEMKPIPQLTLTTGGSYLHAFYRDFSYAIPAGYLAPATGVANLNNTPFPLPQWQINGSATYTLTGEEAKLPVDTISISGDWYYESAIKASFVGYVYPLEQVKGYQFFGARFNAENIMNSKISFSAYVTNLFDEKACAPESNGTVNSVPNATIGTPNTSGVTQCEPLAPRMFGVTMKYVF